MPKLARALSALLTCLSPLAPALIGCGIDVQEAGPAGPVSDSCEVTKTLDVPDSPQTHLGGQCFDASPAFESFGAARCLVFDLRADSSACACDASEGLAPVAAEHQSAVPAGTGCACEIEQIVGMDAATCQNDEAITSGVNGWCFIDATTNPPIGDPKLTAPCPETEKRLLRLVGAPSEETTARQILMICDPPAGKGCSG